LASTSTFFCRIPPGIKGNKLTSDGHLGIDEVLGRLDNGRNTQVFRRIVVLVYGEDAWMLRMKHMKLFKIPWVLCQEDQISARGIGEVNGIRLTGNTGIKRGHHVTTRLEE
jgi:hypothetical protein